MAFKAKAIGREALLAKLREVAPIVEEKVAAKKLEIAKEAAAVIAVNAPHRTGAYADSIRGGRQKDNPNIESFGHKKSKDPEAVGVYGSFIWRFLEFGTKASPGWGPRPDRRFKKRTVMTVGRGPHPATPAQPHVFPTWRSMKPNAKRELNKTLYDAAREALKGK